MSQSLVKPLGLALLGVVIVAGAFTIKSTRETKALRQQLETLQTQEQAGPDEAKQLIDEISKLIVLPEGETPTVATISDREKLKDVAFFTSAENGDKVLLYVNSRKAFLYRPSTHKLIDVATLNLNTANQTFAPKVALRNGTAVAGLTRSFEETIKRTLPNAEITGRDSAKATTYTNTLVVDLTGTKREDAQRLATAIGGTVATLPAGETKPAGADFLIIIGSNRVTTAPAATTAASPVATPE